MAERNRNEGVPQLSAAFRPSPQQQRVCKVQLRRYVTHDANYHIYNACMCALKRMLLKRAYGLFMFSDGVDFLVEDPVRGDLLPDEIQTVENLDGKYEDGELKG